MVERARSSRLLISAMGIRVTSDLGRRRRRRRRSVSSFDASSREQRKENSPGSVRVRVILQPLVGPSQSQGQNPLRNLLSSSTISTVPQSLPELPSLVSSSLVDGSPADVPKREHHSSRLDERLGEGLVSESSEGGGRSRGGEHVRVSSKDGRSGWVGRGREVVEGERRRGLLLVVVSGVGIAVGREEREGTGGRRISICARGKKATKGTRRRRKGNSLGPPFFFPSSSLDVPPSTLRDSSSVPRGKRSDGPVLVSSTEVSTTDSLVSLSIRNDGG